MNPNHLLTFAIVREPSTDIIDTMAGASTDTFNTTLDGFSGASSSYYYDDDDDDDEYEDDEYEYEDDEYEDEEDDD